MQNAFRTTIVPAIQEGERSETRTEARDEMRRYLAQYNPVRRPWLWKNGDPLPFLPPRPPSPEPEAAQKKREVDLETASTAGTGGPDSSASAVPDQSASGASRPLPPSRLFRVPMTDASAPSVLSFSDAQELTDAMDEASDGPPAEWLDADGNLLPDWYGSKTAIKSKSEIHAMIDKLYTLLRVDTTAQYPLPAENPNGTSLPPGRPTNVRNSQDTICRRIIESLLDVLRAHNGTAAERLLLSLHDNRGTRRAQLARFFDNFYHNMNTSECCTATTPGTAGNDADMILVAFDRRKYDGALGPVVPHLTDELRAEKLKIFVANSESPQKAFNILIDYWLHWPDKGQAPDTRSVAKALDEHMGQLAAKVWHVRRGVSFFLTLL